MVYFEQNVEYFPIRLGARVVNSRVVVDLSQFYPGWSETHEYSRLKASLLRRLKLKFQGRVLEVNGEPPFTVVEQTSH